MEYKYVVVLVITLLIVVAAVAELAFEVGHFYGTLQGACETSLRYGAVINRTEKDG